MLTNFVRRCLQWNRTKYEQEGKKNQPGVKVCEQESNMKERGKKKSSDRHEKTQTLSYTQTLKYTAAVLQM